MWKGTQTPPDVDVEMPCCSSGPGVPTPATTEGPITTRKPTSHPLHQPHCRQEGGEEPLSRLHFWSIFKTDVILIKIQGLELHGLRSLREGAARHRQSESATLAAEGLSLGLQTWQCLGSRAVLRLSWDVWILFLTIPSVRESRGVSVCALRGGDSSKRRALDSLISVSHKPSCLL